MAYKNLKAQNTDGKASFTFEVENEPANLDKFQFAYTPTGGAETKVLSSEKSKIKNLMNNQYSWFVPGLAPAKYSFVISGVDASGIAIPDTSSEAVIVEIVLASPGKCTIGNVGGLKVKTETDISVLSWDSIPVAVRYNVYKKNAAGEFVFIESVSSNSYTIHIATGEVKYEDFAIKAVCSDLTESANLSPSTSVQTGPGKIFLLMSIALVAGFAIFRRKYVR
jgi:hypothetical protein